MQKTLRLAVVLAVWAACAGPAWAQDKPAETPAQAAAPSAVARLRTEAGKVAPLVAHEDVKRFLKATAALPAIGVRTVHSRKSPRTVLSPSQFAALPQAEQADFKEQQLNDEFYYYTRYGSPLAYARALDVLCEHAEGGSLRGKRILDFGYGGIGHLRLLASIGCDVVGVEVDPVLPALYREPTDTGTIPSAAGGKGGMVTLVNGSWPGDEKIAAAAGTGFDILISKNTLKNGYINPAREVDQRMLVHLGVSHEEFLRALAGALKPGGLFMVYNICPKEKGPDQPYVPWADGRFPFRREQVEAAGFEVLAWDTDDTDAVRAMGNALGWDEGDSPMDLKHDLAVWYTVLRRK